MEPQQLLVPQELELATLLDGGIATAAMTRMVETWMTVEAETITMRQRATSVLQAMEARAMARAAAHTTPMALRSCQAAAGQATHPLADRPHHP